MASPELHAYKRTRADNFENQLHALKATVHISRHGSTIILGPVAENWKWLDKICGKLDRDFVNAANEKPKQQEHPTLDKFFK